MFDERRVVRLRLGQVRDFDLMAGLEALLLDEFTREIVGRLGEDVEEYSHGSKMGDGIAAGRKRGELGVVDFLKPHPKHSSMGCG